MGPGYKGYSVTTKSKNGQSAKILTSENNQLYDYGRVIEIIINLLRGEVLASELAESNDPKPIAFRSCVAYGVVHQPVEELKNHEYEEIPLRPLPHLQPTRGSGPTSASVLYENTRALPAVVSGQARSTTPSLGVDEQLFEQTGALASTTVMPNTVTPGDKI